MKTHILTIFDKNYLCRALALRESLYTHAPDSTVYFLCLDEEAHAKAKGLNLANTILLQTSDLNDPELLAARPTRTGPEFASTVKPALLLYMMKSGKVSPQDLLVFVDPDFYFYADARALFEKVYGRGSIGITPHRFPAHRQKDIYTKGVYNAGIVFFKNDPEALRCLEEWRLQCIEWCYLRYEDGKIGDQGYMSDWKTKYKGVYELEDKGVNLSTWNIENYKIKTLDAGKFIIDGDPLICYHFHGLKIYPDRNGTIHAVPITTYHSKIYNIYVSHLNETYKKLGWVYGTMTNPGFVRILKQNIARFFR